MNGEDLSDLIALAKPIGLALPRIAAMLMVFPLLPTSVFPVTLRNGIAVALALPLYPLMVASSAAEPQQVIAWLPFLLKEVAIGAAIGWTFGCLIWAFQIVGDLIDAQAGTSFAAMFDPMTGGQAAVFTLFLRNLALLAFLLLGGLGVMMNVIYDSFVVWPIGSALPRTPAQLFQDLLGSSVDMFTFALSMALPLAFLLLILEIGIALISRSIPQMNVFTLAMPLKMLAAILGLILSLTYLLERLAVQMRSAWTLF